jgi:hypothetical protein
MSTRALTAVATGAAGIIERRPVPDAELDRRHPLVEGHVGVTHLLHSSSECPERLPAILRQMPQPDVVEADRPEELPGHAELGMRVGDGEHLLDEVAGQPGIIALHPVGEHDIGGDLCTRGWALVIR